MSGDGTRIVIAGGGIGGLAAALALAKQGLTVALHERRDAFSENGAGIQIGPNGTRILERLGIQDCVAQHCAAPGAIVVHDGGTGAELSRLPLGAAIAARHGSPYWTLQRQDLHAALLEAALSEPRITLVNGSEIVGVEDRGNDIDAIAADGSRNRADAVIGADGLWSKLRQIIAPGATPLPAGKSAYRTLLPRAALPGSLSADDVHVWMHASGHVVHYPVLGGQNIAVVVIANDAVVEKTWSRPADVETVAKCVARFAGPVRQLMETQAPWRSWTLHTLSPLPHWHKGRAVLLGDAAHPVLPFLAQGAVMALEDGIVLARHIAERRSSMPDALAAYQANRQVRTRRVAVASERNGRIYHLSGPIALARNMALRTMPASWIMPGYDWLYGWPDLPSDLPHQ
jgi:salicylate hydroxylase